MRCVDFNRIYGRIQVKKHNFYSMLQYFTVLYSVLQYFAVKWAYRKYFD